MSKWELVGEVRTKAAKLADLRDEGDTAEDTCEFNLPQATQEALGVEWTFVYHGTPNDDVACLEIQALLKLQEAYHDRPAHILSNFYEVLQQSRFWKRGELAEGWVKDEADRSDQSGEVCYYVKQADLGALVLELAGLLAAEVE